MLLCDIVEFEDDAIMAVLVWMREKMEDVMPERFTNERLGQWINEHVDVIRRSIMIWAEFTQFHQTIRVVFCQLCIALGRPWNAGDENGQNRTRRVMNLYHLLEMPAWVPRSYTE